MVLFYTEANTHKRNGVAHSCRDTHMPTNTQINHLVAFMLTHLGGVGDLRHLSKLNREIVSLHISGVEWSHSRWQLSVGAGGVWMLVLFNIPNIAIWYQCICWVGIVYVFMAEVAAQRRKLLPLMAGFLQQNSEQKCDYDSSSRKKKMIWKYRDFARKQIKLSRTWGVNGAVSPHLWLLVW